MKFPKGLGAHRLKDNPEEARFADAWRKRNEHGDVLAHLLDERRVRDGRPPTPADRDLVVAATVIQWLGSPVGQFFLQELGYEKKETPCKSPSPKRRAKP